jgi:hypothetical protein
VEGIGIDSQFDLEHIFSSCQSDLFQDTQLAYRLVLLGEARGDRDQKKDYGSG